MPPARERTSMLDAIGDEAAAKLVAEFGGRRLYVPHNSTPHDPVTQVIGGAAASELAECSAASGSWCRRTSSGPIAASESSALPLLQRCRVPAAGSSMLCRSRSEMNSTVLFAT
jgi:hypothetical protein